MRQRLRRWMGTLVGAMLAMGLLSHLHSYDAVLVAVFGLLLLLAGIQAAWNWNFRRITAGLPIETAYSITFHGTPEQARKAAELGAGLGLCA